MRRRSSRVLLGAAFLGFFVHCGGEEAANQADPDGADAGAGDSGPADAVDAGEDTSDATADTGPGDLADATDDVAPDGAPDGAGDDSAGDGSPDAVSEDVSNDAGDATADTTCAAAGTLGCTCSGEEPCVEGFSCQAGLCLTCSPGLTDCECPEEDACQLGSFCDAETATCVACALGEEGCECRESGDPAGECDAELVCLGGLCAADGCTLGAVDCPCDEGTCTSGGVCSARGFCRDCAGEAACPCDGGTCDIGLLCDDGLNVCRAPLECDDLDCVDFQLCQEATSSADAECLPECEEGLGWTGTECISGDLTCDPEVETSFYHLCLAQNRLCDDADGSANCTGCIDDYIELGGQCCPAGSVLDGGECRPALTCDDITCDGLGQACDDEPGVDASCTCGEGYLPEGQGCRARLQCGVNLDCSTQNRTCVSNAPADDACGGCGSGFVEVDGSCHPSCASLNCPAKGRATCSGTGIPTCGACLGGLVEVPEDTTPADGYLDCVDLVTCSEIACGADICIEADPIGRVNAYCSDDVPSNFACNAAGTLCKECACRNGAGQAIPGSTGDNRPLLSQQGFCICETVDGWFPSAEAGHALLQCDSDQDGWTWREARRSLNFSDPGIREETRCEIRQIDRFLLVPDEPGGLPLAVFVNELGAPTGVESSGGDFWVDLYENKATDDNLELTYAYAGIISGHNSLHLLGFVDTDFLRQFQPAELNPLTRACNHQLDDFNWNNIPDVTEWHGSNTTAFSTPTWMVPFVRMSYFLELNRGLYVPPGGNDAYPLDCEAAHWVEASGAYEIVPCIGDEFGTYVILEKDRSAIAPAAEQLELADGFEPEQRSTDASYGDDPDAGADADYWRECRRSRPAVYNESIAPDGATAGQLTAGHRNLDFAEWSCPAGAGPCYDLDPRVPDGLTIAYDGRDPVGPRVEPAADAVTFAGMNHPSQYRCVQLIDPAATTLRDASYQLSIHGLQQSENDTRLYQMLACNLLEVSGSEGPPDGSAVNPSDPALDCLADLSVPYETRFANYFTWVAVRYSHYVSGGATRSYQAGCINEAEEWPFLCSGYDPVSVLNQASPDADTGNYGHLQCGCGSNGGPDCNVGCPAEAIHAQLEPPYSPLSRDGYWMCGEVPLTSYQYDLAADRAAFEGPQEGWPDWVWSYPGDNPVPEGVPATGNFNVRGQVRGTPVARERACVNHTVLEEDDGGGSVVVAEGVLCVQ